MKWIQGGITAPKGFRAAGVSAGIKRLRKPDLCLVVADKPAAAAAVFTRNQVKAAPVLISERRLRSGRAQAVVINSGCANCMTGPAGHRDALATTRAVAKALRIPEGRVLVASTGMIGTRLPMPKILRAVPGLAQQRSISNHTTAALAMLTTDLHPKEVAVEDRTGGIPVRVGGMAKGAGMIAPSMATMLCVITTDARIAPALLRRLLRQASAQSFDRISVDGDMSTNDAVFAFASGGSGAAVRPGSSAQRIIARMLQAVTGRLARLIVKDGEGASRIAEIIVEGGRTDAEAQACARQIANSPLVKTMLAGADPNVGRVAAAAGASPAKFDAERLEMWIGSRRVVAGGVALPVDRATALRLLAAPEVAIRLHLHAGRGAGRMLTCDLTKEYVHINARYST